MRVMLPMTAVSGIPVYRNKTTSPKQKKTFSNPRGRVSISDVMLRLCPWSILQEFLLLTTWTKVRKPSIKATNMGWKNSMYSKICNNVFFEVFFYLLQTSGRVSLHWLNKWIKETTHYWFWHWFLFWIELRMPDSSLLHYLYSYACVKEG